MGGVKRVEKLVFAVCGLLPNQRFVKLFPYVSKQGVFLGFPFDLVALLRQFLLLDILEEILIERYVAYRLGKAFPDNHG